MSGLILPEKRLILPADKPRKRTSNASKLNAVRNPDGLFINTSVFREAAIHFMKYGYYCGDRWGTPAWREYWERELIRCKEGYTVGGVRITGHHYGYLNYAKIERVDINSIKVGSIEAEKGMDFPDFWDGDYNYFHALEIARNKTSAEEVEKLQLAVKIDPKYLTGGRDMLIGKARRRGYSFKNGWICANVYNTMRGKLSLIGAFDKAYLYGKGKGTMTMASDYLNFLNEHTGWRKSRDFVDRVDDKKASYKKEIDGVSVEAGYKSEIVAITFKDNPSASRGKDPYLALLEEVGAWPGFKEAWAAIAPSTRAGIYKVGQIIGFGTGGDMESGTADFADMFYHPELYNLMPFMNIWDEEAELSNCGFFHPMQWNREGFYDRQGNSDIIGALAMEKEHRDALAKDSSSNSLVLQTRVQEEPTCPAEAFLTVSTNNFPIIELRRRYDKVKREGIDKILSQPVTLFRDDEGKVRAKPDMEGKLTPIWNRLPETNELVGAVLIKEYPMENSPRGLYKIGYDPVALDDGTSMNSITVIKATYGLSQTSNTIVCRWVGRHATTDITNEMFGMICELYNAQGMHENMVGHVKTFFRKRNKLHLLAAQPDAVISASIKESNVERIYGCHMNDKLRASGEQYIINWLLTERGVDDNGKVLTTIDFIDDLGLLDELILYTRKGNQFDRVMSLMMALFQIEEEQLGRDHAADEEKVSDLIELMPKLFRRASSN